MREPPASAPCTSRTPQMCWSGENSALSDLRLSPDSRSCNGIGDAVKPVNATRSDEMAAVGHYSAVMSRELHHPLTSLVFDAEAALRWLDRPQAELGEVIRGLERMRDAALRAVAIARSLQALAVHAAPSFAPVLIEDLLEAVLRNVARDIEPHRIAVETEFPAVRSLVRADAVQIQQVLVNLIGNAIDAMAVTEGKDRRLSIAIRHVGSAVHCSISDTGTGMEADTVARVFEPFYSTRPAKKGLGLTIARAIIEAHGGKLEARSRPGIGSTLSFHLDVTR
ncbi:hypothetical protein CKO39_24010 [Rhodopseudomonas palustris]|nr:hypothetical protein CKO39_24010 [Rhodopseudomonas palustris]